jgi:hypothetical protein
MAIAHGGRPAGLSPTPAICASWAISPVSLRAGLDAMAAANAAAWPGVLIGERRAPARSRPCSPVRPASMSMATLTGCGAATPAAAFSIMSRCSGQSAITVMAAAAAWPPASRASAVRSAVG